MSYSEKLRDPRWQKKRLEIMNRDCFKCIYCQDSESPLTVHHIYYISGREPWGYPDSAYLTLCEKHHGQIHAYEVSNSVKLWEATAGFEIAYFSKYLNKTFFGDRLRDSGVLIGISPEDLLKIISDSLEHGLINDAVVSQWKKSLAELTEKKGELLNEH